jgi:hypothetical protein
MRRMCKKRRENDRFGLFCCALFVKARVVSVGRSPMASNSEGLLFAPDTCHSQTLSATLRRSMNRLAWPKPVIRNRSLGALPT